MTVWKFRPGDVVGHKDYPVLVGVIVRCKLSQEVDSDMGENNPWYVITWTTNPVDEDLYQLGQENECQLVPIFRPVDPWGHPHGPSNPNGFNLD